MIVNCNGGLYEGSTGENKAKTRCIREQANIQTAFNPSLYRQANRNFKLANIRVGDNNSFKWSVDGGKTWTILHIPTGCYELKAINAEIISTYTWK